MSRNQYPEHEGLQYDHSSTAPEVVQLSNNPSTWEKQTVQHDRSPTTLVSKTYSGFSVNDAAGLQVVDARSGTICGMRKRIFWVALVAALVVVVIAAVLGGVVGSKVNKNKRYVYSELVGRGGKEWG
jgi:hypothetical protein